MNNLLYLQWSLEAFIKVVLPLGLAFYIYHINFSKK